MAPNIVMEADRLILAKRHPVVDPTGDGSIKEWKAGKVRPGQQFTFRGEYKNAPSGAHAVDPSQQEEIDAAKVKAKHDREMAAYAKKAEAAAMAARAAAAAFQPQVGAPPVEPVSVSEPEPPKRSPGRPKGSKNKPKALPSGEGA